MKDLFSQINETYQHPGKWHDVVLQPGKEETFSHVMSHNIRGLDPGAVYEAIVQAKNRYGWNQVSDLYQFYTRGYGEHYTELGNLYLWANATFFTSSIFLDSISLPFAASSTVLRIVEG